MCQNFRGKHFYSIVVYVPSTLQYTLEYMRNLYSTAFQVMPQISFMVLEVKHMRARSTPERVT